MEAGEVVQEPFRITASRPGFRRPLLSLDDSDEVHQVAPTQRIMDHMAARTDPVGAQRTREMGRKPGHRDHAAPCDLTREARPVGPEKPVADARMDAVGADEGVALDAASILELQRDAARRLGKAGDARPEPDRIGVCLPDSVDQHAQKVRPIDGQVGEAVVPH